MRFGLVAIVLLSICCAKILAANPVCKGPSKIGNIPDLPRIILFMVGFKDPANNEKMKTFKAIEYMLCSIPSDSELTVIFSYYPTDGAEGVSGEYGVNSRLFMKDKTHPLDCEHLKNNLKSVKDLGRKRFDFIFNIEDNTECDLHQLFLDRKLDKSIFRFHGIRINGAGKQGDFNSFIARVGDENKYDEDLAKKADRFIKHVIDGTKPSDEELAEQLKELKPQQTNNNNSTTQKLNITQFSAIFAIAFFVIASIF